MDETLSQPLLSHLIELRSRLVRITWGFMLAFIVTFYYSEPLYNFFVAPLAAVTPNHKLLTIGIVSPFFLQMKIAALAAFLITLPHTLYQVWAFVAPGLYTHEKRLILPLVVSSSLLFLLGIAFAYFFVFGTVFHYLVKLVPGSMEWLPESGQYMDFALNMFLAFGLAFEVPIAVVILVRTGIVGLAKLREIRSYVIVGAFAVAAVVTPPDVMSQLLLAIPLCLLYEAGLWAAHFTRKPDQDQTP